MLIKFKKELKLSIITVFLIYWLSWCWISNKTELSPADIAQQNEKGKSELKTPADIEFEKSKTELSPADIAQQNEEGKSVLKTPADIEFRKNEKELSPADIAQQNEEGKSVLKTPADW